MRNQEGGDKQDQKGNFKRDGYKGKKNPKAMQANTWDDDEEEDVEGEIDPNNDGSSPFCFMAQMSHGDTDEEEKDDFDAIIAANNLTDPIIIEYLRKIHIGKKKVEETPKVTSQEEMINEEKEEEIPKEKESKVETNPSSPPKEAKVCLNSSLNEDESIHIPYCASMSDSDYDDDIEDASIFTNERMLKLELARANKLLNETNQALIRSEGTNEELVKKVLELESKVNKFVMKESEFEKQRNDFVKQISNLKFDKQLLNIENRTLKSTSVPKNDARLDLTNLCKGQKSNDKSGLGYKRISPSLHVSNYPKSPKGKGKQILTKESKHAKPQVNKNAPNHAFRYRFSNGNRIKNKPESRHYNPSWSNNIYLKEPTGWRYEEKNKHVAQSGAQLNEKPKFVSQQTNILNTNNNFKTRIQAQELKNDYHNRFVKVMTNPPTSALCNYCCRLGHISLECAFRKGSNMNNVVWVPKINK